MNNQITIPKPFDGHFHPREGEMMQNVLPYTAGQFFGGVAMGNLPGDQVIDTMEKRGQYLAQIKSVCPDFNAIVPLMVTKDLLKKSTRLLKLCRLESASSNLSLVG